MPTKIRTLISESGEKKKKNRKEPPFSATTVGKRTRGKKSADEPAKDSHHELRKGKQSRRGPS